ncbi:MAG: hypothetical protein ACQZ3M_01240 [cyanobacterium endosymbiont of Rhopalodia fuxianensis]
MKEISPYQITIEIPKIIDIQPPDDKGVVCTTRLPPLNEHNLTNKNNGSNSNKN